MSKTTVSSFHANNMLTTAILLVGFALQVGARAVPELFIAGGFSTTKGAGYVGQLKESGVFRCTAVLIASDLILTSTMCKNTNYQFHLQGSSSNIESFCDSADTGGVTIGKLSSSVGGTPIPISFSGLAGSDPDIIGWGKLSDGSYPTQLHYTTLAKHGVDSTCKAEFSACMSSNVAIKKIKHMCLYPSGAMTTIGAKTGDSGGAVVSSGKLYGIITHLACSHQSKYTVAAKLWKLLGVLTSTCGCQMKSLGTLNLDSTDNDNPGSGDSDIETNTAYNCSANEYLLCMECKKKTHQGSHCPGTHDGTGDATLAGESCNSDQVQNPAFTCDTASRTATCDHTKMTGGCDCCDYKIKGFYCYSEAA